MRYFIPLTFLFLPCYTASRGLNIYVENKQRLVLCQGWTLWLQSKWQSEPSNSNSPGYNDRLPVQVDLCSRTDLTENVPQWFSLLGQMVQIGTHAVFFYASSQLRSGSARLRRDTHVKLPHHFAAYGLVFFSYRIVAP